MKYIFSFMFHSSLDILPCPKAFDGSFQSTGSNMQSNGPIKDSSIDEN